MKRHTGGPWLAEIRAYAAAGHVEARNIHGAKGREWGHVLIVGATEGALPHYKARSELARQEERDLLYVAATHPASYRSMSIVKPVPPRQSSALPVSLLLDSTGLDSAESC